MSCNTGVAHGSLGLVKLDSNIKQSELSQINLSFSNFLLSNIFSDTVEFIRWTLVLYPEAKHIFYNLTKSCIYNKV